MTFAFHPDAEREFDEAVAYYENCQPGLGMEFAAEVYAAIRRILRYPQAWATLSPGTRRCLTNRFPYGVVYEVKADTIRVVAIAHLHRRPGFWRERL